MGFSAGKAPIYDDAHLSFTARQHMCGQVDVEGLSIGGKGVVPRDFLGHAGDKHPGSCSRYCCESMSGCSTAIGHRGEGQTIALAWHPPSHRIITSNK